MILASGGYPGAYGKGYPISIPEDLDAELYIAGAKEQDGKSKAAFFLTSAAGLAINEGMMLLFRALWGEDAVLFTVFSFTVKMYLLNKVLSTFVVMVWNYFTKRYILTGKMRSAS